MIKRTASPVSVGEGCEERGAFSKEESMVWGAFEISENALDCCKVRDSGIVHVLTYLIDREGYVRACPGEVLESSN